MQASAIGAESAQKHYQLLNGLKYFIQFWKLYKEWKKMLAVHPDKEQIFYIILSFLAVVISICHSVKNKYQDWNLTVYIRLHWIKDIR